MSAPKKRKDKKLVEEVPDLTIVFREFRDAYVLVFVACRMMEDARGDEYGPSLMVLRQGVDAFTKVSDKLEKAEMYFDRIRRKNENRKRSRA